MFFVGIMGVSSAVKPVGEAEGPCPACGGTVRFHVVRSYNYFHFFFIPLFKFGAEYLATCPGCASVFRLHKETGDRMLRGGPVRLEPWMLNLMKNNREGLCPACGRRNPPGSAYCNGCGRSLF